jgi:cytochrome P450
MNGLTYDPFSEAVRQNPYPHYAALRELAPVHRLESTGFYVVTRYEDVMSVVRRPEQFSSCAMQMMMRSGMGGGVQGMGAAPDPAATEALAKIAEDLPFDAEEMMRPSLIGSDPPNHQRLRNIVNRGFTPRRIAALEPRVREIARDALDRMLASEEVDLVSGYTIPLPVRVIAELLGVEPERQDDFKRWSDEMISASSGSAAGTRSGSLVDSFREFNSYFVETMEKRRKDPKDDLISALVAAEHGEASLTPAEGLMFTRLLLVAGNETTTNLLGNGIIALLQHPEQMERVRSNPELIPGLVEESLRFDSPVQMLFRQATGDVELAETKIPKGAIVLPVFASANRDETQFTNADEFDVTRRTQGHIAFGFGIHFCLGASLARLEARVGFEELLARTADLERLEEDTQFIDSFLLRGPASLRVRATAS